MRLFLTIEAQNAFESGLADIFNEVNKQLSFVTDRDAGLESVDNYGTEFRVVSIIPTCVDDAFWSALSTGDGSVCGLINTENRPLCYDETVLYGSSGRKAEQDYAKLNRFFEEGQRYAAGNNRATFDRILNDIKSSQRSASNGIPSAGGRGTTVGDVFLPFGESDSNGRRDVRDGKQNSEALTNQCDEGASDDT